MEDSKLIQQNAVHHDLVTFNNDDIMLSCKRAMETLRSRLPVKTFHQIIKNLKTIDVWLTLKDGSFEFNYSDEHFGPKVLMIND